MRAIKINNPVLDSYITDLSDDYISGTSLLVRNNNSFSANDLIVTGNPGEERTEQKKANSLNSTIGFTLASDLNFSHNKGTPVYKSLWDFVSIEGRSSSAGVFAVISTSPIQWDSNTKKTIYFHSAGTDTWEYRFRFYNSVTSTYSEYSSTATGTGYTRFQAGYIIGVARKIAGDEEERIMSTLELLRELRNAKYIIRGKNAKYWFWRVDGYNSNKSIPALADTDLYSLDSIDDIGVVDSIEYVYTENNANLKWQLDRKGDSEFRELTRDLSRPANNRPRFYRFLPPDENSTKGYIQLDNKIQTDSIGTLYVSYYKDETNLDTVDASTSIIIPEILQDYLISKIYAAKGNADMAKRYEDKFYGPDGKAKTQTTRNLEGIALLDSLDAQYKRDQSKPLNLWNFKGQKALARMYGSRRTTSPDYARENFFNSYEDE